MRRFNIMLTALVLIALVCAGFEAAAEGSTFAFVNKTTAPVYTDASSGEIKAKLSKYAVVKINSDYSDTFYTVTSGTEPVCTGYMAKPYLTTLESQEINAYFSTTGKMYSQPSTSASYLLLAPGRSVRVVAVNGSWAMIYDRYGNAGYTKTSSLTKGDSVVSDEPEILFRAKVTAGSLQCYTSASTSSAKAGTLKKGDIVKVIAYDSKWVLIKSDNIENEFTGYCSKSYLVKTNDDDVQPEEPVQILPECEPFEAVPSSSKLSVYSEPSVSSTCLGSISSGTRVQVIAYNSEWANITLNGNIGYAKVSGLKAVKGEEPEVTPAPEKPALPPCTEFTAAASVSKASVYAETSTSSKYLGYITPNSRVTVLAYDSAWAYITLNGNYGYAKVSQLKKVEAAATPAPDKNKLNSCDPFLAVAKVSKTKVYSEPSTSSTGLGTISPSVQVTVLAYNSEWTYITLNGNYGYTKTSGLKKVNVPANETLTTVPAFTAKTTVSKLNVYAGTSTASAYLGYVKSGTEVQVLAYNSNWAYITLNGNYGYAQVSGLAKVQPAATPTPAPTASPTPVATPVPTKEAAAMTTPAPTQKVYPDSTDPIFTDTSTTNQQKAYLFLATCTDYNEAVACGLISNFVSESNCNPKSVNSSGYRGICQWSTSRFAILDKWCNENNLDPDSLEGQLKFLRYDLSQRYTLYHKYLLTVANTAQGAYDAGYYFCLKYERPGNTEAASEKRGNNAKNTYWPKFVESVK